MIVQTEAIVLKQHKIANNRRMIVLFTKKYGKISAGTNMNEGRRGKSALALRPFAYSDFELYKKGSYYNINGSDLKKSHYPIGEKLDRFMASSDMISYLEKIIQEEQPSPKIFDLSIEFLEVISKANDNFDTILLSFYIQSLKYLGIMPELKKCVNCGEKIDGLDYIFSVEAGGGLCNKCTNIKTIEAGDRLIFRPTFDIIGTIDYFANNRMNKFLKISLKRQFILQLKQILNSYVGYYLDVDILNEEWGSPKLGGK